MRHMPDRKPADRKRYLGIHFLHAGLSFHFCPCPVAPIGGGFAASWSLDGGHRGKNRSCFFIFFSLQKINQIQIHNLEIMNAIPIKIKCKIKLKKKNIKNNCPLSAVRWKAWSHGREASQSAILAEISSRRRHHIIPACLPL